MFNLISMVTRSGEGVASQLSRGLAMRGSAEIGRVFSSTIGHSDESSLEGIPDCMDLIRNPHVAIKRGREKYQSFGVKLSSGASESDLRARIGQLESLASGLEDNLQQLGDSLHQMEHEIDKLKELYQNTFMNQPQRNINNLNSRVIAHLES